MYINICIGDALHYFYDILSFIQLGLIQAIENDELAACLHGLSIQMQSNLLALCLNTKTNPDGKIDAASDATFNNCKSNISSA